MDISAADLKRLSLPELEKLALTIRTKIIDTCLTNGGHLGASLGAVEIAIALHATFDSPKDKIIWDVGHQAYAHKLLTGRWDSFSSLRLKDGLSGFLSRAESEHDAFGAGHSSTALSAALGISWAKLNRGDSESWTVAVIGDGALTAGLFFEALNNLSSKPLGKMLIILNDNQMSISANVGAIPSILADEHAQDFFDLFQVEYQGPINGHDLGELLGSLEEVRDTISERPVLLHLTTQKGKGYELAEASPQAFHGVSPKSKKIPEKIPEPGAATPVAPKNKAVYSEVFGRALVELAKQDPNVVAITAAMSDGTGLAEFEKTFPDRFFDVGIAEPHAVVFAAGLSTQGLRPVVAIYSTFLQRALDAIIHDVALQNLPVVFAIDRAGWVGADGPTHHGAFDLSYLGAVPGLHIYAPSCYEDLRLFLRDAISRNGPTAIRFPRGGGEESLAPPLVDGVRSHLRSAEPKGIAIALGTAAMKLDSASRLAFEGRADIAVLSTPFAKPFSAGLLKFLESHPNVPVLTIEDGALRGGFGESLRGVDSQTRRWHHLGYPDRFVSHGSLSELESDAGLDILGIQTALTRFFAPTNR